MKSNRNGTGTELGQEQNHEQNQNRKRCRNLNRKFMYIKLKTHLPKWKSFRWLGPPTKKTCPKVKIHWFVLFRKHTIKHDNCKNVCIDKYFLMDRMNALFTVEVKYLFFFQFFDKLSELQF
jgi:hypothetical protein